MRLSVRHATVYTYEPPMRFVTQSHRLTPSTCASQRVVEWEVTADAALFGAGFIDGGGDLITTMTVQGPVERIEVVVQGIVETTDTAGVLRNHREVISPRAYLQPTHATAPTRALLDLKDAALEGAEDGDDLGRAHRLAEAVAEAIAYAPNVTHAHSTAAEALEQGAGVCQDHAHVLIALAHAIEMPARYVTGYLLTEDDTAGEASHAWAELYVSGLGWIGFDPANGCCPDVRYVRLGSGRDAREAAPIRGVARGGGSETLKIEVSVDAQQQQPQQ